MVDRATNLLVLLLTAAALLMFVFKINESWKATAPWEREWRLKESARPSHSVEELLGAMQQADALHEHQDVEVLKKALEADFVPTGVVLVRISSDEIYETLIAFAIVLATLVVPVSLNYVRRGKFILWNRKSALPTGATSTAEEATLN